MPNSLIDLPSEMLSKLDLLQNWRWHVGEDKRVFAVSASGDAFLEDPRGTIYWLDCASAKLERIAENRSDFYRLASDPSSAENWFMISHIQSLERAGMLLRPGQCYGFRIPPVLGGKFDVDNRTTIDFKEHISFLGELHNKIQHLPEGATIRLEFE